MAYQLVYCVLSSLGDFFFMRRAWWTLNSYKCIKSCVLTSKKHTAKTGESLLLHHYHENGINSICHLN